MRCSDVALSCSIALGMLPAAMPAQVAVKADMVFTIASPPIEKGIVVITNGKIAAVGKDGEVAIPEGHRVLQAKVVTPGLIDAHTTVGLSGYLNQTHDQDQLDRGATMQPELRALDAYNPRERLIEWVRSFGVTTIHTGHAPGQLISGQTIVVKTHGETVEDALVRPLVFVTATLGDEAQGDKDKSPGSRPKAIAMLRALLLEAKEYARKREAQEEDKRPARDLRLETMARIAAGELPLLVTAHRDRDLLAALRLKDEFGLRLVLDGASEAHMILERIKASGVAVIASAPMQRHNGERENATFELCAKLDQAGIPFALQSGYESYVPKTRVVLFEAAIAAAHGLGPDKALRAITIDAARLLGIDGRVGSLEVGKDGDLALFDGDPFEYTTHCVGVVIEGRVVSESVR